jgi:hypothetical protein
MLMNAMSWRYRVTLRLQPAQMRVSNAVISYERRSSGHQPRRLCLHPSKAVQRNKADEKVIFGGSSSLRWIPEAALRIRPQLQAI